MGRRRGRLTTKFHARVDGKGRLVRLLTSPGNDHDVTAAGALLAQGAVPNIANRANRKKNFGWKKAIYRQRNHVERFLNKLKQFRRIATRYDKLGATFVAVVQLAGVRISQRSIESTA